MNFKKAFAKLREKFPGKYVSTEYKLSVHTDGELRQECCLYIDDLGHFSGSTWERAFDELENPTEVKIEEIEELTDD